MVTARPSSLPESWQTSTSLYKLLAAFPRGLTVSVRKVAAKWRLPLAAHDGAVCSPTRRPVPSAESPCQFSCLRCTSCTRECALSCHPSAQAALARYHTAVSHRSIATVRPARGQPTGQRTPSRRSLRAGRTRRLCNTTARTGPSSALTPTSAAHHSQVCTSIAKLVCHSTAHPCASRETITARLWQPCWPAVRTSAGLQRC
jgi:hypothetical protein